MKKDKRMESVTWEEGHQSEERNNKTETETQTERRSQEEGKVQLRGSGMKKEEVECK